MYEILWCNENTVARSAWLPWESTCLESWSFHSISKCIVTGEPLLDSLKSLSNQRPRFASHIGRINCKFSVWDSNINDIIISSQLRQDDLPRISLKDPPLVGHLDATIACISSRHSKSLGRFVRQCHHWTPTSHASTVFRTRNRLLEQHTYCYLHTWYRMVIVNGHS